MHFNNKALASFLLTAAFTTIVTSAPVDPDPDVNIPDGDLSDADYNKLISRAPQDGDVNIPDGDLSDADYNKLVSRAPQDGDVNIPDGELSDADYNELVGRDNDN